MQPFETIFVDSTVVACDGGDEPMGHPLVYLNLGTQGKVECPYCSRLYLLRGHAATGRAGEAPPAAPLKP